MELYILTVESTQTTEVTATHMPDDDQQNRSCRLLWQRQSVCQSRRRLLLSPQHTHTFPTSDVLAGQPLGCALKARVIGSVVHFSLVFFTHILSYRSTMRRALSLCLFPLSSLSFAQATHVIRSRFI